MKISYAKYEAAVKEALAPLYDRRSKMIQQMAEDTRHFLDMRISSFASLVAEISIAEALIAVAGGAREEDGLFDTEYVENYASRTALLHAKDPHSFWAKSLSQNWAYAVLTRMHAGLSVMDRLANETRRAKEQEEDRRSKWIVQSYSGCWYMRRDLSRTKYRSKAGIFKYDERPDIDKQKWRYVKLTPDSTETENA